MCLAMPLITPRKSATDHDVIVVGSGAGSQVLPMNDAPFRREALKRVIGVSVALTAMELNAFAATPVRGIGTDPNLLKKEIPWPLVLTDAEKRAVTAFATSSSPPTSTARRRARSA